MKARPVAMLVAAAALLSACGGASTPIDEVAEIPAITPSDLQRRLAASPTGGGQRVGVLVRSVSLRGSAARAAASEWGDRVVFIGIDVRDTQEGGRGFIGEFGLTSLDHGFDPNGAVPAALGGVGVPLTFFFHPGGELAYLHRGVIDERTLALWLDTIAG